MASQRQIIANRQNALRSTGPVSDEGKARASRNATKHGIFSQQALLPEEDEQTFNSFREGMYRRFRPADELERMLADRVVVCAWKLRRVLDAEAAAYASVSEKHRENHPEDEKINGRWKRVPGPPPSPGQMLARHSGSDSRFVSLTRYEMTLERGMYKALNELRRVQADRINAGDLPFDEDADDNVPQPPSGTGASPVRSRFEQEPLARRVHGRGAHATGQVDLQNEANSPANACEDQELRSGTAVTAVSSRIEQEPPSRRVHGRGAHATGQVSLRNEASSAANPGSKTTSGALRDGRGGHSCTVVS